MNKIQITVKFFATRKDQLGVSKSKMLLQEGTDVDTVLKDLITQHPELVKKIDCAFVLLNEVYALPYAILKEGDTLSIILPVMASGESPPIY
jgi:molybdopterin converting factor small subunit